ncbi:MAG TPA: response regulator [Gemmataceae bacterium]|nr:response regulator [Gemmataceae bacterium]
MPDSTPPPPRPGVLVVDDEPQIRNLLEAVLRRSGFAVWTADGGRSALDCYQKNQSAISVVLLDVRMPGMDGPQTLAGLLRINPAAACCFMTGHAGDYTPEGLLALGAVRLFEKPFRLDDIASGLWQTAQLAGRRTG